MPATPSSTCSCPMVHVCSPCSAATAGNGVGKRRLSVRSAATASRPRAATTSSGLAGDAGGGVRLHHRRRSRAGENVIVAGDHFAGKTTLLRAICLAAIAPFERVVTVEAAITELGLDNGEPSAQRRRVVLAAAVGGGRGRGDGGRPGRVRPPDG